MYRRNSVRPRIVALAEDMTIMLAIILQWSLSMRTSTIAEAKNNLSQLIHQLETGEVIHLTRYGKPVAVLISEHQDQNTIASNKSLNSAILNWRSQTNGSDDAGFNDQDLQALRKEASTGREFTWGE